MKYLPILLIILATAFVSCKKEPQSAVSGKWQQTKLVINVYNVSTKVLSWDSTYLSPFTRFDYIQFNVNGNCVIAGDFYLNAESGGSSFSKPVQSTPSSSNYDYSASGSVYVLTPTTGPSGVYFEVNTTADTVSIHGNTLLQHTVNYNYAGRINSVIDSYYSRQ